MALSEVDTLLDDCALDPVETALMATVSDWAGVHPATA
jgi:hypothetical protein